jgi:hypothetical protein
MWLPQDSECQSGAIGSFDALFSRSNTLAGRSVVGDLLGRRDKRGCR